MRPLAVLCLVLPLPLDLSNAAEPSTGLNAGKPTVSQRVPDLQQPVQQPVSDFADDLFDYDVYMADPGTAMGWYIQWTYADGVVVYTSPSQSEIYTLDLMVRLLLRGYDPRNWMRQGLQHPQAAVVALPQTPHWVLVGSFDFSADAQELADFLQDSGMLSKVETRDAVSQTQLSLNP